MRAAALVLLTLLASPLALAQGTGPDSRAQQGPPPGQASDGQGMIQVLGEDDAEPEADRGRIHFAVILRGAPAGTKATVVIKNAREGKIVGGPLRPAPADPKGPGATGDLASLWFDLPIGKAEIEVRTVTPAGVVRYIYARVRPTADSPSDGQVVRSGFSYNEKIVTRRPTVTRPEDRVSETSVLGDALHRQVERTPSQGLEERPEDRTPPKPA